MLFVDVNLFRIVCLVKNLGVRYTGGRSDELSHGYG